jgi:hypothetical protein
MILASSHIVRGQFWRACVRSCALMASLTPRALPCRSGLIAAAIGGSQYNVVGTSGAPLGLRG